MKKSLLKVAGLILVVGAVLGAITFQVFGSGLISPANTQTSVTTIAPNVTETVIPVVRVHTWRIVTLLAIVSLGLLCMLRCNRQEPAV